MTSLRPFNGKDGRFHWYGFSSTRFSKICLANEHSLEFDLTIAEVCSASVPQMLSGGSEWGAFCLARSTIGRSSRFLLPIGGYSGIGEQLAIGLHIRVSSGEQNIAVED